MCSFHPHFQVFMAGLWRYYGLNYVPTPPIQMLTPYTQNVTVFGDRAFKEVTKVKGGCEGGPKSSLTHVLTKRGELLTRHTRGGHAQRKTEEDTARGRPFARQEERPRQTPHPQTPRSWTVRKYISAA